MIYLDNAATTKQKPACVIEAVVSAMKNIGNSSRGAYDESLTASRVIFETRMALAELFHCADPNCVIFTANSTEALNMALNGLIKPGDHVITTDLEHNSVLRPLYRLEREAGVSLSFAGADRQGRVTYEDFEHCINEHTRMIVCTHCSNLTGNLLDLERIGELAHRYGLLFVVDASQTAGVFPVDMERMHMDALCFTGHKSLFGPQGTGGLCLRKGLKLRPLKVGGSGIGSFSKEQPQEYPEALEAGTLNGHGIAGLGAGVRFIQEIGMERIRQHELKLAGAFYQGVSEVEGVTVYGDFSSYYRAPIVALNICDLDSAEVSDELAQTWGIAVRAGAHCAPRMHQALGTAGQGAVRFSFSWFNTMEETETAVKAVRTLASL